MYVFFIQLEPDIDHITPIAYKLAKEHPGNVSIVCTNILWDINKDYRIRYLRDAYNVEVNYLHRAHRGFFPHIYAMELLLRMPRGILRLIPPSIWNAFYFKVSGSILTSDWARSYFQSTKARCVVVDVAQPNSAMIYKAAQSMNIPVVMVQTANVVLKPSDESVPSYVTDADYLILPNTLTNWYDQRDPRLVMLGCMRYCDEWQAINSRLLRESFPSSEFPENPEKLNVLIFGWPGKHFNRDHSTFRRIADLQYVSAIFKERPRVTLPRKLYEMRDFNHYPSARLIQWADVVICSITSVILDVLYYDKTFIYAKYVAPEESATFEDYNACWTVKSEEDLLRALETVRRDRNKRPYSPDDVRQFFRDAVYSGISGKDVLSGYSAFLESLSK